MSSKSVLRFWRRATCSFFFFFQAEDGIRDRDVTGVQTCALPISAREGATPSACRTGASQTPTPSLPRKPPLSGSLTDTPTRQAIPPPPAPPATSRRWPTSQLTRSLRPAASHTTGRRRPTGHAARPVFRSAMQTSTGTAAAIWSPSAIRSAAQHGPPPSGGRCPAALASADPAPTGTAEDFLQQLLAGG